MDVNWVTRDRYSELSGVTKDTIRGYINDKKWIRGTHFRVIGRTTYVNIKEVEKWLTIPQVSDLEATLSRSDGSTKAGSTRKQ